MKNIEKHQTYIKDTFFKLKSLGCSLHGCEIIVEGFTHIGLEIHISINMFLSQPLCQKIGIQYVNKHY